MKFIPRRITTALLSGVLAFFISSCGEDVPSSPVQTTPLVITQFTVTPGQVTFSPENGIKDSVVVVTVSGSVAQNTPVEAPLTLNMELVRASDSQSIIVTSTSLTTNGQFEQTLNIPSKTTDFNDYRLYVYIISGDKLLSNSAFATIKIRGFALGVPEILATNNPDTVRIPSSGTTPFALRAKVTHPDGQALLDRILVDIRDQQNNLLAGSPFRLFDDGNTGGSNSGDAVAADSIFTRVFNIDSTNNPDVYQLFYYAIDTQGASSDTVQTQMVIQR